ncbi:uncharacterized protein LOC133846318 [Drosophila sulfurigaster albostrigata]|uniref:uncharacterized protein LOC133846318 n=1 Tax=Drosophila sulfurigaster albostrigata TaxID=89887 RepID=UPI002D21BC66|nr:uncharacterized protein LOC133846318 [Drosophila sulfurigaster albostrigata]
MTAFQPVTNCWIEFQMFKRENGYKPWLMKSSWDACRFLKKAYNPFAIIIYRQFKDFSNLNHSCPYVGDVILEGFYLQPELLGLVLPTGDYLATTTWFIDKKKLLMINGYFKFTEDLL